MSEPWFRPRAFGYGAGLPIHWKEWALMVLYMLALAGSSLLLMLRWPIGTVAWGVTVAALTLGLVAIARRRTRGEWRWRWGEWD